MTGTSYPSGAPKFCGDPLTSNNIVTGTSYPSGASDLCGDPLTLAHSHICQLQKIISGDGGHFELILGMSCIMWEETSQGILQSKLGFFFQSSFCRDI